MQRFNSNSWLWQRIAVALGMLCVLTNINVLSGQVTISTQVPLTAIDVCGPSATFTVTLSAGASATSNTLSINQPAGMHYEPGSVMVSSTNASITVTEQTIVPDEDPVFAISNMANGDNVTFTYRAYADCSLIGVNMNSNSLTFTSSSGSPAPHITNGYNTRNGVMNITGVTNSAYFGVVGNTYTRVITVRNGGQGAVNSFTLNITNGSGFQIQSISGGSSSATLPAQSTTVTVTNFTGIGDGDNLFENNETITISETVQLLACTGLTTNYKATFGCFGSNDCGSAVSTTFTAGATINGGMTPNVSVLTYRPFNTCISAPSRDSIVMVNNGTDAATNVKVYIGVNANAGIIAYISNNTFTNGQAIAGIEGIYYKNLTINGVSTPLSSLIKYYIPGNSCFGAGNIPADAFTMGYFTIPLIPVGGKVKIEMDEVLCCNTSYCPNFTQNLIAAIQYQNGCQTVTYPTSSTFVTAQNGNGGLFTNMGSMTTSGHATISDGQTKTYTYRGFTGLRQTGAQGFGSAVTQGSLSQTTGFWLMTLSMPLGLTVQNPASGIRVKDVNGLTWPTTVTTSGSDFIVRINIADKPANWDIGITAEAFFEIECDIYAIPGVGCGNATITLDGVMYPSDCTPLCGWRLICAKQMMTNHICPCTTSACCPTGGSSALSFDFYRTQLGYADNNNDGLPELAGTINLNRIERQRFVGGDTMRINWKGLVVQGNTLHTDWNHSYFAFSMPYGAATSTSWDIQGAGNPQVEIVDATTGTRHKATLPTGALTFTTSGTTRSFILNYSPADYAGLFTPALPGGFYYDQGDSILLRFAVMPQSKGLNSNFSGNAHVTVSDLVLSTSNYLSNVANPSGADQYTCSNINQIYSLVAIQSQGYGPNWNTNCNSQSAGAFTGLSVLSTNFPFEARTLVMVDSARMRLPNGWVLVSATLQFSSQPSGTVAVPVTGIVSGNFVTFPSIYSFYTVNGGTILPGENSSCGIFLNLRPTCAAPQTQAGGLLDPINIYCRLVGSPGNTTGGPNVVFTGTPFTLATFQSPVLSISSSNANITALSNTVSWDIQVANGSPTNVSPNTFIYEQPGVNGVTITSVQRLTACSGGTLTGSPLTAVNGIYQLGTVAAASTSCYRVTATYTSCIKDSTTIGLGYDCAGYPASIAAITCTAGTQKLTVTPVTAGLQTTILQQPNAPINLCDAIQYELLISNPNLGTAGNVTIDMTLATALELGIEPGSSYLAFPSASAYPGSANLADPVYNALTKTFTWTISNTLIGNIGGLLGTGSAPNNTFKLLFSARTTACAFRSGDVFTFTARGTNPCGTAIASTPQITQPLTLLGAPVGYNTWVPSLSASPLLACGDAKSTITVTATNQGPGASVAGEFVRVIIPNEYTYVAGSFTGINNAPVTTTPVTTVNGANTEYQWSIPAGISPLVNSQFSFQVQAANNLACVAPVQLNVQTGISFSATCSQPPMTVCTVDQLTGTGTTNLSISRPQIEITSASASAVLAPPSSEQISFNAVITNTGTLALTAGESVVLKLYGDSNGNGTYNSGDTQIGTATFTGPLAIGASGNVSINTTAAAGLACPLFAVIEPMPCMCAADTATVTSVPVSPASLSYAVCSGISQTIGTAAISGYSYAWTPTSNLNSGTIAQPVFNATVASSQTFNFTYTTNRNAAYNSCNTTQTVAVTVDPPATANAGNAQTVCAGGTITLAGSIGGVATSGTWSAPSGSFSNANSLTSTYTPSITTGTVTLTLTTDDPSGPCPAATSTVVITISPVPDLSANAITNVCPATTADLTSTSITDANGTTGTLSYHSTLAGASNPANNTTDLLPTPTAVSVPGTYYIRKTTAAGCFDYVQVNATQTICPCLAPPSVQITETNVSTCQTNAALFHYSIANGPTTTFAHNGSGVLSLSQLPNGTGTFTYTPAAGDVGNVVTITATIADPDGVHLCGSSSDVATVTVNNCAPCNLQVVSATPSLCGNNTYNLAVVLNYSSPPGGSAIVLTTSTGSTITVPQTSSPQTVTLSGLTSNGMSNINVSAYFVTTPACTHTLNAAYTAPVPCLGCKAPKNGTLIITKN